MNQELLLGIGIVTIGTILGASGALCLKFASQKLKRNIFSLATNPFFYSGAILYFLSSLFFVYALRYGELSVLYPVVSLSYIWTIFLSMVFLGEKMNKQKWLGITLIMLGVILVGISG